MLTKIKDSMRIKHSAADTDLNDVISAGKADLKRVGVKKINEDDPLIIQAMKLYAKWQFDFELEAERYRLSYEKLRDSLSLCGEYNV